MAEAKARTINLHCPKTSKIIKMAVWEHERVDLGSIGRALGLDPKTVKLNAHFVARDINFVACSVTWKSLLSFFASKGLSANVIVVDGKPAEAGTKRSCDSWDSVNGTFSVNSGRSTMEETDLIKTKKLRNGDSVEGENGEHCRKSALGYKRKQVLEDLSFLKRLRINETCHTGFSSDIPANANNRVSKTIFGPSPRCTASRATKRMREENVNEAVLTTNCKRIR